MILILVLLLTINFLTIGIYNYVQKKNEEFTTQLLQAQNDSFSIDYYKMLLQQNVSQNILVHDLKNHLRSIAALNQQGEVHKIDAYINHLIQANELQGSIQVCNNELLNTILCRYIQECKANHIDFHIDIRSNVLMEFPDDDLTALFCNLLDNAYESASITPNSYINLNVSKQERTPFTVITMINTCCANPFSPDTGELMTTKKDTLSHGYGLKSVQRIINQFDGNMNVHYDEETRTFHTIIIMRLP